MILIFSSPDPEEEKRASSEDLRCSIAVGSPKKTWERRRSLRKTSGRMSDTRRLVSSPEKVQKA
jgi:hypothetical protein